MVGSEANYLSKRINSLGGHKEGINLVGKTNKMHQIPQCHVDLNVLNFYKEIGLYKNLKLDSYFKQSVGASYDKCLFLPAIMHGNLAWSKFKRYFRKDRKIRVKEWEMSKEWMFKHFSVIGTAKVIPDSSLRETLGETDLTGSCGFNWGRFEDKFEFIDENFDIYLRLSKEFSYRPVAPWRIFIKEELREGSKVLDSISSRIIWGGSVVHFIASFKLFYDLQMNFLNHRDMIWSSCGLNFSGREYSIRMNELSTHAESFLSVDGSSFDASMQPQDIVDIFECFVGQIRDEYKDENFYNILSYVMSNEISSLAVLPEGEIVFKETGNPSGSFTTLIKNTYHDYRLYAYTYICACFDQGIVPSYKTYTNTHKGLMNGDDCKITASEQLNWKTIQKYMSPFLELTSISIDGKYEIPFTSATYCGCTPFWDSKNFQFVPYRNSYKMLLSLLFMNESALLLKERVFGLMVCNPFDDYYISILLDFCDRMNFPAPDISKIRAAYMIKESEGKFVPGGSSWQQTPKI
jgi:hypothetical protein